jgi:hypothetical protein
MHGPDLTHVWSTRRRQWRHLPTRLWFGGVTTTTPVFTCRTKREATIGRCALSCSLACIKEKRICDTITPTMIV